MLGPSGVHFKEDLRAQVSEQSCPPTAVFLHFAIPDIDVGVKLRQRFQASGTPREYAVINTKSLALAARYQSPDNLKQ